MKFLSRMTMFCQSFLWLATLVVCNSFTSMRYRTSTIISSRLYDNQNDINGGGGPGYVDDEKRSSEMQPSMTDVRNSNRQGGSMDRLEHGASVNILSVTSLGFLKNIEEYGKARMARKAVGILSKMQAYGEEPLQEHYTAAVGACEQSDQFDQSIGVFKEMKAMAIKPVVRTYEHLISCAEKTGHWEAALALFEEMTQEEGLIGTTNTYNSCMWAAEQGGRPDISLDLLSDMEQRGVHRDAATYAACAYSCEKAGQGQVALHVMDLMRTEGHEVSTLVYKAAIWACTKGGMWETALSLFDEMEPNGQLKDEESYSGAIWACVNGNLAPRAVELLKLMKFDGLPRKAVAYDGALTALQQAGMWAECLDMISWMDREGTAPTETTYTVIMQVGGGRRRRQRRIQSSGTDLHFSTSFYFVRLRSSSFYSFYFPHLYLTHHPSSLTSSLPLTAGFGRGPPRRRADGDLPPLAAGRVLYPLGQGHAPVRPARIHPTRRQSGHPQHLAVDERRQAGAVQLAHGVRGCGGGGGMEQWSLGAQLCGRTLATG